MIAILLFLIAVIALVLLADRIVKRAIDKAESQGRQDAIDLGAYTVWHEGDGGAE